MKRDNKRKDQCRREIAAAVDLRSEIPAYIEKILRLHNRNGRFNHIGPEPIPSREAVIDIVGRAFRIIYPGYFTSERLDGASIRYYFGQQSLELFEVLSEQIAFAIRHDCIRFDKPCVQCEERGQETALKFLAAIPALQETLSKDVRAAYEGDPASRHHDEIIFCYPGLFAVTVYRIAHWLHLQGVPLIPRIMTEYAHSRTGIDIHPGVTIGESFFMDHGTGIVIGETTNIGDRVRIYQGVTLGALSLSKEEVASLRNKKRHPTIEDDVIIYANATILGGRTVIGARSVIGGNVWLIESVPPDSEVFLKKQELVVKKNNRRP
ncbi:MAG: Serine acetyltransferase [Syntrophorhabdus sp. PtaU1.Bin058]|nr:MAG: Serine acetyltransferase [Syntrophorhabdus sp. PtaU1.Bin058]